jgi:hypothetical protein
MASQSRWRSGCTEVSEDPKPQVTTTPQSAIPNQASEGFHKTEHEDCHRRCFPSIALQQHDRVVSLGLTSFQNGNYHIDVFILPSMIPILFAP